MPEDIISTALRPVGLVENTSGKPFQCGTCEYMGKDVPSGQCGNKHPKLYQKPVEPKWCCNLYNHDGMRTIIK